MMNFILALLLFLQPLSLQRTVRIPGPGAPAASGSGGTFTEIQSVGGITSNANNVTCVSAVCTLTLTQNTGASHGAILLTTGQAGSGVTISSVSGGCASWQVASAAHISSGPLNDLNGAYCTSTSSGSGTVAVTFSSTSPGTVSMFFFEASESNNSISYSTAGTGTDSSSGSLAGVTLSVSGNNMIGQQIGLSGGIPTAVSSPYSTYFVNKDAGNTTIAYGAAAMALTTSGTAPTWTISANASALVNAIALVGN